MKKMITLAALLLVGSMASAQVAAVELPSVNAPTASNWAIGMVEIACDVNLDASELTGTITKNASGVVYTVTDAQGQVVAAAKARTTSIFSRKTCL